ncbi:putative Na+/H+ antiporter [Desulfogranum japonicum]|uniref:putative Na+/H+ antiporter n=1 Tax=Desulfogranum japonicum TaxID=231447 RepID=UPI000404C27C|nr:putative Na+/H+ antiporter [Desulfogranum japonicum]
MNYNRTVITGIICITLFCIFVDPVFSAAPEGAGSAEFPMLLKSYNDADMGSISQRLLHRIATKPFNLLATLIFLLAIVHTFMTSKFLSIAHQLQHDHEELKARGKVPKNSVSHKGELFHFLGEVEAVFGIWAVALGLCIALFFDWSTLKYYLTERVNFTEPLFVVVIMTLAATRPILKLSEQVMEKIANFLGGSLVSWWFTILTLGPLIGSLITEPAAMTISALLLSRKFYDLDPPEVFKYATLGLLFVNISIGGTLTHFAAPPVLMVANPWDWGTMHMLTQFGWKATLGILTANAIYWIIYRSTFQQLAEKFELRRLKEEIRRKHLCRNEMEAYIETISPKIRTELKFEETITEQIDAISSRIRKELEPRYLEKVAKTGVDQALAQKAFEKRFEEVKLSKLRAYFPLAVPESERAPYLDPEWDNREDSVPWWVIVIHVAFMGWTIFTAHYPELFIPGMLFFLGFAQVTAPYQNRIDLKQPLLVGFFLGGLVIHGGVQGWWIEPVLGSLNEIPLMLGSTILTAFNDNAAITFLSTLVPEFTDTLKYSVVAGAVSGGGLTVIANAPNPAGQSLLKHHFKDGISPIGLLKGALLPTVIIWFTFLLL